MAVTKAQLVVWALIAGLGVWGSSELSRVKLPENAAPAPVAKLVTEAPAVVAPPAVVEPAPTPIAVAETLPATIPQFPFPEDLATATVGDPAPVVTIAVTFAEIPSDAIPQIATVAASEPEITPVSELVAEPAAVAETMAAPVAMAAATEEPPIPMPSRPVVAQPTKAVPLEQVKTLYVVADTLNVRAAPSTDGPVLQKVPQGFAVAAREQSNEWIGFVMRDGSTGWMRTDYLSDTMPPPAPTSSVRVWTEPLNLMM